VGERHLVALGGGGFGDEPDSGRLDDYILSLTGASRPRVCFIPTASGDAAAYIVQFYSAFPVSRCLPSHLGLFRFSVADVRSHLLDQDVIYVGGGSTVSLLAVWRAYGLPPILRQAWERGVVLCGVSAGSLCWFEAGVTLSFGQPAALRDGLGLVSGSHCPHFNRIAGLRDRYRSFVAEGAVPGGLGVDDGVAVHFVGDTVTHVVADRPDVAAYRLSAEGERVVEERLSPRYVRRRRSTTPALNGTRRFLDDR
jgi:peptidase E